MGKCLLGFSGSGDLSENIIVAVCCVGGGFVRGRGCSEEAWLGGQRVVALCHSAVGKAESVFQGRDP